MDADLSFLLTPAPTPKRRAPASYEEALGALQQASQALDSARPGDPARAQLASALELAAREIEPFLDDTPPAGAGAQVAARAPGTKPEAVRVVDAADAAEAARRRAERAAKMNGLLGRS